jgi:hypothetical protein
MWGCGIQRGGGPGTTAIAPPAIEPTLHRAAILLTKGSDLGWAGVSQRTVRRYFADVMQSGCDENTERSIALGVTSAAGNHSVHSADDMTSPQIWQAAQGLGVRGQQSQIVHDTTATAAAETTRWTDETRWRTAVQAAHLLLSAEVNSRVVFHGVSATVIQDEHWHVIDGIVSSRRLVRVLWQAVIASREQLRIDTVTSALGSLITAQRPDSPSNVQTMNDSPFTATHRQQILGDLLRRPTLTAAPTAVTGILIDPALTASLASAVVATGSRWPAVARVSSRGSQGEFSSDEFGVPVLSDHPLCGAIVTNAQHLVVLSDKLAPAPTSMPAITFRLEGGHATMASDGIAKLFPTWSIELANGQPTGRSYRDRCISVQLSKLYAVNTTPELARPLATQCWFVDGIATSVTATWLMTTAQLSSVGTSSSRNSP